MSQQDPIGRIIVHTNLEDGRAVCLRAIRPDDEPRMRDGIELLSKESRYLRFFSRAPALPDRVITSLVAVDGHHHLAWGAILSGEPDLPAIGAAHAVRSDPHDKSAEFAIGILDAYHGLGLARMLTAVLLVQCRSEEIGQIEAQILAENQPAARLLRSLGAERWRTEQGVSDYRLDAAAALHALQNSAEPAGLKDVFEAFDQFV
jgi:ribosomal protein S18 acetylase RimI-like enzyme